MKVYLGPYKNWFGPYQIADLLQHVGVSEDRCHDIGTWLSGGPDKDSWLQKLCVFVDSYKTRSTWVHIDRYDTWSMDSTLAILILPMLKQLRDTKHGSPGHMPAFEYTSNSAQLSFPFYEEGDELAWRTGHEQWTAIMDEMIWTFEQLQPDYDWENQYWLVHPEMDLDEYPEDEGKVAHPVRRKVEGRCDWEGRRIHGERIQKGLELFGQYYNNLWD